MSIRTDLASRLRDGRQLARQAHVEYDVSKKGTLRAGNSGMMSAAGDVAGSCHRRAHLRSLGLDVDPPDDSKLIMFQMGTANEDLIYRDLLHTCSSDEVILREEEIPIKWLTSNGTVVTGRPDMVVCQRLKNIAGDTSSLITEGAIKPLFGVEIKSIASVWTSRDVLGEMRPKLEHLIQAGHYSWKLGVPFRLLYKQYSIQEIPGWTGAGGKPGWSQKLFPASGTPGSEYLDYEKGRIQPFEICYELEWRSSFLNYRREGTSVWTKSLVSAADIERYYEFVSQMGNSSSLGPRPLTIDPQGKEKNWSICGYCPLQATCDKHESKGYDKWIQAVRKELKV